MNLLLSSPYPFNEINRAIKDFSSGSIGRPQLKIDKIIMFKIGLDLDNTIINYNIAFYSLAKEKMLIEENFQEIK